MRRSPPGPHTAASTFFLYAHRNGPSFTVVEPVGGWSFAYRGGGDPAPDSLVDSFGTLTGAAAFRLMDGENARADAWIQQERSTSIMSGRTDDFSGIHDPKGETLDPIHEGNVQITGTRVQSTFPAWGAPTYSRHVHGTNQGVTAIALDSPK